MDKKKIIGIVVFIVLGLFIFTFANPGPSTLDPVEVPGQEDQETDDDKQQEEEKEEQDEEKQDETVGNIGDEEQNETLVDYYQLALEAIEKAEESLLQNDVDSAKDLVENVNNNKQDLVDRVENVQNVVDYNKLLTELENKTNSSTNKDELNSARDYNTSTELANKLASLNDDANKEKLLNRYNALLPKLNDTTAPVVSGLDKKYTNQIVKLTITDDSSFSANLNGKNYVSGNEIKEDGVYNLVAVDASFNETVVTFTIDTTLPKTSAANILINGDSNNDKVFYGTYGDKIYTYVRFSEELKQIPTFKLINNGKEYIIDEKDITVRKNDNGEYQYSAYVELTKELGMIDGEITMNVSNIEDKAGNKIDDIIKPTNGHIVYLDTTPAGRVYSTLDFDGTGIEPEIDGTRRTYYIKNGSSFVFRMQFTEQLLENPILNVDNKQVELKLVDKYVTEEGKYIYQGKVEINAEDNFKDGILVLILSNVKDLAGNETADIKILDQTVTSNDRTAIVDNTAPTISIVGTEGLNKNEYRIESGTAISLDDILATASDASFAEDIKIEPKKVDFLAPGSVLENNIYNYDYKTNGFDTRKVGRYDIYYQITDKAGNISEEKLMMLVMTDTTAPVVTINGKNDIYVEFGSKYNELGATMTDNVDATITNLQPTQIDLYDLNGNFKEHVTETGVNPNVEGKYLLYYDYVDGAGNSSKTDNGYTPYQAKRWVIVEDTVGIIPSVTYKTNNDGTVTATITTNKSVEDIAGWTKVNDTTYTKTYDKNVIEEVTLTALSGKTTTVKVEINNVFIVNYVADFKYVIENIKEGQTVYINAGLDKEVENQLGNYLNKLPNNTNVVLKGEFNLGTVYVNNALNISGNNANITADRIQISNNGSLKDLSIVLGNKDNGEVKVQLNSNGILDSYTISNVNISGGYRGLNIHGVNNAVVDNVNITECDFTCLAIASSNVTISNSSFAKQNANDFFSQTGSIRINYESGNSSYPIPAVIDITNNNNIDGSIYIEGYNYGNEIIYDKNVWKYNIFYTRLTKK